MTEIVHKYREVHTECCQLLDAAFDLFSTTQGRAVASRMGFAASEKRLANREENGLLARSDNTNSRGRNQGNFFVFGNPLYDKDLQRQYSVTSLG